MTRVQPEFSSLQSLSTYARNVVCEEKCRSVTESCSLCSCLKNRNMKSISDLRGDARQDVSQSELTGA